MTVTLCQEPKATLDLLLQENHSHQNDDDKDDDDDDDDDDLTVVGPLPRSKENSRKESRRSRAIQSPPPEVTIMRAGHGLRYVIPPPGPHSR